MKFVAIQTISFADLKKHFYGVLLFNGLMLLLLSCSVQKQISKQATAILLHDSVVSAGHVGISIYEPGAGKYWYNYNAAKYFVPASNTKLFSLYAGLKYLGDSLIGLRYQETGNDTITIYPTGDPTFLHPDYKNQRVFDFLSKQENLVYHSQSFSNTLGKGWAWDDYLESYMAQRSEFPIYGNLIRVYYTPPVVNIIPKTITHHEQPAPAQGEFRIEKPWDSNDISLVGIPPGHREGRYYELPFFPGIYEVPKFLADTIHHAISVAITQEKDLSRLHNSTFKKIYSQPADSLYKPMMHNSDNFFAEQTLLMASNERLGYMSDEKIIDSILNSDLKDIPQKPNWVDGSGLSRYNLFTPQSFVYILNKMKNDFGLERLQHILPTGGEGTLASYYKNERGFIFAKTGTLSNHCALSGFIITKKNKLLIFSILVNDYQDSAVPVRKAIEKFLKGIRERY